mmetsp:Transcript_59813/g.50674  ORF Transcript_59813/g.50674 Transcript_59813/m.50674 type:complete len:220 (-) Transcript_59813:91-750(-)
MLNGDGSELRHRPVAQPVSQPGVYQEESILRRHAKMREEDMEPVNMWIFVAFILMFCVCCGAMFYFVLQHDDHWVIDEIHHGHYNNVRDFLEGHHDISMLDHPDAHQETLMHHAVESNQPSIVQLLIHYGAKLSVRNKHQQTPLHLAVYHGWPAIVKVLVDAGAPITLPDDKGREPLEWSERLVNNNPTDVDRTEVWRLLKKAKAKKDALRDSNGLGDA